MENTRIRPIRGFLFYFKIYWMIALQDIKSKMSYRSDFLISTIGMIAVNVSGFLGFWLVFQTFHEINGWKFNEILFLYACLLLTMTPNQIFFDNNWSLRYYVYSGDFVKYCFRPINLFFYFISEVIDVKGFGQFFFGLFLLIYSWIQLQIPVTVGNVVTLLVCLLSGSLVVIALMVAASATCFWLMNSGFIMVYIFKFTDYAKYPLSIFNKFFQVLFTVLIPIGFIAYYPSLYFLRPNDFEWLTLLCPVVGAIMVLIAYKIWMYGASKYSGTGS